MSRKLLPYSRCWLDRIESVSSQTASSLDRLIVALDYPTQSGALQAVEELNGLVSWVKVGLELYLAEGRPVVDSLLERKLNIFLDLKLHDIPNTVAGAVRSVSGLGIGLLTVHACGGPAMLEAAANAAAKITGAPKLLAVTVLTSMDRAQLAATGIHHAPAEQVALLGKMAIEAGIDGLVCSGEEIGLLREAIGSDPLLVVPGIRPAAAAVGDQKRVVTPAAAIHMGASKLVVGRPITQAADPAAATRGILDEIAGA